ncbi:hypothetical protein, partial [Vibrio parahaemolyticus]|uniref:hypothetical protein n=1 Tax=Vibrio parahaemolyticus TaxID=670 RepID=UPI00249009B3
ETTWNKQRRRTRPNNTKKALLRRQYYKADFQKVNQFLKQKNQTAQETKERLSQTQITIN